jgi:hypothetical protein
LPDSISPFNARNTLRALGARLSAIRVFMSQWGKAQRRHLGTPGH